MNSAFPQQMMSEPMLNVAEQYGKQFAEQQKEKVGLYFFLFSLLTMKPLYGNLKDGKSWSFLR